MDWLPDAVVGRLRNAMQEPELSGTRYELRGEIGRGGMGVVYLVYDTQLQREVALKVVNVAEAGGDVAARMAREARVLAMLEHPGVVPVHDAGTLPDGRPYCVMKRVDGERLREFAAGAALPDRLRVFIRICETAAFAHSRGVVHRDLKPENVMVGKFGEVLVMDWGAARVVSGAIPDPATDVPGGGAASETRAGTVIGTPDYMPPEQAAGRVDLVDARSDVFALGRIIGFLLEAGSRSGPRPKSLDSVVRKATAAAREARYGSALDLASDVSRYLDGDAVLAHRESAFELGRRFLSRNRMAATLVAVYILVRVLIFFWSRQP